MSIGKADALIKFGGSAPHAVLMAAARAAKVPMFVVWAGSDVSKAIEQPNTIPQARRTEISHLAVAPWLVEELNQAGINARYIPIIGFNVTEKANIPLDEFNVLTYLPEPRRDFYGRPHIYEVAKKMTNCNFLVVGAGMPDPAAPANVRFLGLLPDITPILDRCAAVLRVPDHDGMSLMVLEALARGRFVAWNHAVPGARLVETSDDTVRFLSELRADWVAQKLEYNAPGLAYIASIYDERQVALNLQAFLDEHVDAASRKTGSPSQIAISGLDIFVADLADLNNNLHTGWNAQVLQFETTYEVIASLFNLIRSDVLYTVGTPTLGRGMAFVSSLIRKPRVMHWVGTDIEAARRNPTLARKLRGPTVSHLTEVQWEADELHALGIEATIAPLPPRISGPIAVPALPPDFTLLVYLPRSRAHFYGKREVEALVQIFSGKPVKFLIVGGGDINAPANAPVENVGWRYSLADVYERSTALFRFTPRDGLSLMVLEALSFGRHVLWTKTFPFVEQVTSLESAVATLTELLDRHQKQTLTPQLGAADFIHTVYDRRRCIRQIAAAWDRASAR